MPRSVSGFTAAAKAVTPLLSGVLVKDIYVSEDGTALTLRYKFSSNERTLTKQELQVETDKISDALKAFSLVPKI